MSKATVSAGYLKELLDFAVSHGANRRALADIADIPMGSLENPDNRIPMGSYIGLMRAAKQMCDDPALPLRLGAANDFHKISVVGLLCYAASNMFEAYQNLNRYGRLVAEFDLPIANKRFDLVPADDGIWFVDTRNDPDEFPEMTEETWARFVCENRRHFPDIPYCKAVRVTHAEPSHSAVYQEILQAPVIFGCDNNALLIDENWPGVELHQPNAYAFGVLSEHADALLASLENVKSVKGKVESMLIPILHKSDVTMGQVATDMGVSRQTLYRKLKAEGVNYETLLDELRHQMALHYLGGKKASVNETAYLVGFSDPGTFSRAFKRWTGVRPSEARASGI